ncbi:MAG: STAS domain-containing protein [Actinoplanes sp.]
MAGERAGDGVGEVPFDPGQGGVAQPVGADLLDGGPGQVCADALPEVVVSAAVIVTRLGRRSSGHVRADRAIGPPPLPALGVPDVPPSPLSWHLDVGEAMSVMTVRGALDAASSSELYRVVERRLEQKTTALIMDLSAVTIVDAGTTTVFREIVRRAGRWPGTPVLLCAPDAGGVGLDALVGSRPATVFGTVAEARAALAAHRPEPPISEQLLPTWGEAHRARDLTTEACLRWGLPHLVGRSALAVSELVINAVEHARTVMTLQVELGWQYLYIAVFDGVRAEPAVRRDPDRHKSPGNGLVVVQSISQQWGFVILDDGKVVWAAFRRSPD